MEVQPISSSSSSVLAFLDNGKTKPSSVALPFLFRSWSVVVFKFWRYLITPSYD